MKRILLLTFAFFGAYFASAQDVLIKKSGEEIPVKVLEITPDLVKYKRFDNPEGPIISARKSDLFLLRYANGSKEVFSEIPPAATAKPFRLAPAEPLYVTPQPEELAPEQVKLNGPRIGLTLIDKGELSRKLDREFEASRLLTQFGWQFETQIFMSDRGTSGLLELIPLIGGLEQGLFLPSISGIIGLRGKSGFEVGVGPNVSLAGAGLVFATGATIKSGNMNYPLNFAFVPSKEGARYSFMIGFNYRKKNQ